MSALNRVILVGNLTRDPEGRTLDQGSQVTNFGLAINERYKNKQGAKVETTCFVDIAVWGAQADACERYLKKGSPVLIEGRLQYESWETSGGERRSRLRVKADRVQFLPQAKSTPAQQTTKPASRAHASFLE